VRYHALACDFDGTLAHDGRISDETADAVARLRKTGRRLVMVTGRQVEDLLAIVAAPVLELFDLIVAENGAVVYVPATRATRTLAEPPAPELVQTLRRRKVEPLSVGRVIVATERPHEVTALEVIQKLGLELQVIFNKGSVMLLPSGVNKATGLAAALEQIGMSMHNVVAVGDAENDHALLASAECAVAVANSVPTLKQRADLVTTGANGAGVRELCDRLIANDLRDLAAALERHDIPLGTDAGGHQVRLPAYGAVVLVAGSSGGGKSTFAAGLIERLGERHYQHCIIDPEGDYTEDRGAVVLGDAEHAPSLSEITEILEKPRQNAVVNLLAVPLEERPRTFEGLFARLQEIRARHGRPHWIIIDEVHHLLPAGWDPGVLRRRDDLMGLVMITVHPHHVAPPVLAAVDAIIAIGAAPADTIHSFGEALGEPVPAGAGVELQSGEAIVWWRSRRQPPLWMRSIPPEEERRRHRRKYMDGELEPDHSFYFRGAEGKLNLRAQNLSLFLQLGDGVDDATWRYHLKRGDYSRWLRDAVKDPALVSAIEAIERGPDTPAGEARRRVRAAIEHLYTAPSEQV